MYEHALSTDRLLDHSVPYCGRKAGGRKSWGHHPGEPTSWADILSSSGSWGPGWTGNYLFIFKKHPIKMALSLQNAKWQVPRAPAAALLCLNIKYTSQATFTPLQFCFKMHNFRSIYTQHYSRVLRPLNLEALDSIWVWKLWGWIFWTEEMETMTQTTVFAFCLISYISFPWTTCPSACLRASNSTRTANHSHWWPWCLHQQLLSGSFCQATTVCMHGRLAIIWATLNKSWV